MSEAINALEQLEESYRANDEIITISLPKGQELKVRALTSATELETLEKRVQSYIKKCNDPLSPEQWKPFLPASDMVIRQCVYCAELIIEPQFTVLGALRLAKTCGNLIPMIGNQLIERIVGNVMAEEEAAIDDLKND